MSLTDAKRKITEFSPQFRLQCLSLLGSGTDSDAYLANEEWIFRFPRKFAAVQKTLETEIALLPQLREALPVAIPDFKYVAKDAGGLIYVGYPMLPGVPLGIETFYSMQASAQGNLLKDLAAFLESLHRFSVKIAKSCGVQEELYKGAYHAGQRQLIEEVGHLLSKGEREAVLSAYKRAKVSPISALLHADLKPEHILYRPEDGHMTGVIDWGDVCIGDPDFDFTCLNLFYDREFVSRLLPYFPNRDKDEIFAKIQFFITVRWLQDTAQFLQRGDDKFVEYCLKNLRNHLDTH